MDNAKQFFADSFNKYLAPLSKVGGVIEVTIEGQDGGSWFIDADLGEVSQTPKQPNCIVRAQYLDFKALLEGRMSASAGLLTERLHLAGDSGRLFKLMDVLETCKN